MTRQMQWLEGSPSPAQRCSWYLASLSDLCVTKSEKPIDNYRLYHVRAIAQVCTRQWPLRALRHTHEFSETPGCGGVCDSTEANEEAEAGIYRSGGDCKK